MQSKYRQFIAVLMIIGARTVSSKKTGLKMVMDKPADVCDGFDESKFLLDYSSLEFVQTDDDQFHISGVVTVKETIEAPIKVIVSSSKSVNGMWVSGLINTSWEDVCEEFDHPTKGSAFKETLGPLTKDGHCPFQKGTHEYGELKFESISQMMEKIPRSLIGKWRAKVQFQKDGHVLTCNYFYFTFIRT